MVVPRTLLTLAERVPGRPVGDAIWEVIATVPTLVHPSMGIGVDLGQLEERQEMTENNPNSGTPRGREDGHNECVICFSARKCDQR